jgi:hypothetical protein
LCQLGVCSRAVENLYLSEQTIHPLEINMP